LKRTITLRGIKATIKSKFSLPIYLVLYALGTILGFAEAGVPGMCVGLGSSILCSLASLAGIIPFAGIPLYLVIGASLNSLIASLGVSVPITQTVTLYTFLIFVVLTNIVISTLAFLLIVALIINLLNRRKLKKGGA